MSHWVTLIFVDIDIYQSEIQVVHPYIVGLSVVGGMSVWDSSLEGAVRVYFDSSYGQLE